MEWIKEYKGFLAFALFFFATLVQFLADILYSKDIGPLSQLTFLIAAAVWTIQEFEKIENTASWKIYGVIVITTIMVVISIYLEFK